jgi:hypothetical protein
MEILDNEILDNERRYRLLQVDSSEGKDAELIRGTFRAFGSMFAIMLFMCCYLRRRAPRCYNVRSWIPGLGCDLAKDQFGFLSWMWKVYQISDDEILDQCGLDALCFLRVITLGFKVCCVGIFNSIYLLPLYATAEESVETASVVDTLEVLSLSNVPSGSKILLGTVFGVYILFGFTMYLLLGEFEWYTAARHKFLQQRTARNYGVYVSGIPEEYRSSHALLDYFRTCFSKEGVLEAHVAMDIPNLESKVAYRDTIVARLEHALHVERVKGVAPQYRSINASIGKGDFDLIKVRTKESFQQELIVLNKEISESVRTIETINHRFRNELDRANALKAIANNIALDDPDSPPSSLRKRTWSRDLFRRDHGDEDDSSGSPLRPSRRRYSTEMAMFPFEGTKEEYEHDNIPDDLAELGITKADAAEALDLEEGIPLKIVPNSSIRSHGSTAIEEPAKYVDGGVDITMNVFAGSGGDVPGIFAQEHEEVAEQIQNDFLAELLPWILLPELDHNSPNKEAPTKEEIKTEVMENMTPLSPEQDNLIPSPTLPSRDEALQRKVPLDHTLENKTPLSPEHDKSIPSPTHPSGDEAPQGKVPLDQNKTSRSNSRFIFGGSHINSESTIATISNSNINSVDFDHKSNIVSSTGLVAGSSKEKTGQNTSKGSLSGVSSLGQSITSQVVSSITKGTGKAVKAGTKSVNKVVKVGTKEVKYVVKEGGQQLMNVIKEVNTENLMKVGELGVDSVKHATAAGIHTIKKVATAGKYVANSAMTFIMRNGDGRPRDAGFVSFTKLSTTHAALQMIHHPSPYIMNVSEAPDPEDIYWGNVGTSSHARYVGYLMSLGLSAILCLFWTIPITFISSLTEVASLKETLKFLNTWIENAPWLEKALGQLAPLMLIILNLLLPVILREFAKLEGHIASSVLEASLFVKLSAFTIIQTFFVSAISGSISAELNNMIKNPKEIVNLLANSLPAQSTYFIQIVLVSTFLGQGLELLRVKPLGKSWIRSLVGPTLTIKERNTSYLLLRPLSDPDPFQHAEVFAQVVLYFMVLFVYTTIAPLTSYFVAFCFIIMGFGYRHQFIYNYPTKPDSGGKLWSAFVGIALTCMLIAQITLAGMFVLKKATYATPTLVPLMIITVLFNFYIRQDHFYVTNHLPTRECLLSDRQYHKEGNRDYSFSRGKYLQPALHSKHVYPEGWSGPSVSGHVSVVSSGDES